MKPIYIYKYSIMRALILIIVCNLTCCKKFVTVPAPVSSINAGNVFTSDETAIPVLTGIYSSMAANITNTVPAISLYAGLSSDELNLYYTANATYYSYYANTLSTSITSYSFWSVAYTNLLTINSALEGLQSANSLTPAVKQQLLGEAKFMRAFCYFYLVNLYGDVPLVVSSNYHVNDLLPRSPKAAVYNQIISDLKSADSLLSNHYLDATLLNTSPDRVRPTSWAAKALLARTYLYYGNLTGNASDYSDAITESSAVINNTAQFSLSPLANVFLGAALGNNEAIFQLQPVNFGQNTPDAWLFILPATGPGLNYPVYLSPNLINSFEPGDQRKTNWTNSVTLSGTQYYYAFKYKSATLNNPVTEDEMALRLGEQYLIRAEAEAQNNDLQDAAYDLDKIRSRAGLANTTATTQAGLLTAILHERQVELFTEWGHRWLDLKRTGTINTVMTSVTPTKGTQSWNPDQALYPIPLVDIQRDPNLVQNPGY